MASTHRPDDLWDMANNAEAGLCFVGMGTGSWLLVNISENASCAVGVVGGS